MAVRQELRAMSKGLAFISPWLFGFLAFTLLPVGLSLYFSFCDYSLLQPAVFTGMDNYRELYHDPVFWISLRNTLVYAAIALPAGLMVSLGLALLLNVKTPGQSIYRTAIFLPSLVPVVASSMLWLWLFNAELGLINYVLRLLGVEGTIAMGWLGNLLGRDIADIRLPPNWLGDVRFAMPALAFMSLWGVGHTVVIYLAGLQDVPKELYEAAEIDGAGTWRRLWHVTLPMISPVIFFNLVMAIIGTWQVFTIPYIMTQGGPARATYFFTMYLYDNAFVFLRMGYASAMAWIQLLIILSLTGLAFWSSRRWVHYQGR
jgi:multiple sugar transport system permease protein